MRKTVPPLAMFIVAVVAFGISAIYLNSLTTNETFDPDNQKFILWFFRVITALAASAVSISIPGMLKIEYNKEGQPLENSIKTFNADGKPIDKPVSAPMSLAEKESTITAGGALAVFVLVYLFNPINGL
ncbi:hypothetical protein [uncultured Lacinutrix sp.]|uniref:hypothetical protein n=1 Tax=uncultured Lacinutrix sp. TaxID=574032 RepID=UPI00260EF4B4|nr:hypothetical protein [uncultured Lacinutrix sp.]